MTEDSSPLVSVITPVLNAAGTLELTLASVAAQTYPNIEHIVIDGGSNDGTIDLVRRFRSKVPLRWVTESDSGMYAAINKGIEMASGQIISYLNADDLYMPWSVECAVSALSSSSADLIFGDALILVKRHGRAHGVWIQVYPRFDLRVYAYEVVVPQPTVFWRREVSDALGGFDETMRYSGDFEYWLRAGAAGCRYVHVRELLAVEVQHEAALSTVHAAEVRQEIEIARARYRDVVRPRRFPRIRAVTRLAHWRWLQLALRLNFRRDRPSAWGHLIQFLRKSDLGLDGSSVVPLLVPAPLPRTWSLWRVDPGVFEDKLSEELRCRCSGA